MKASATIKTPTNEEIEKIIEELRSVDKKISDFTTVLQPDERGKLLIMAPGSEAVVAALAHLVRSKKVAVEGMSIERMEDHFMLAQRLKTLHREAQLVQQRLEDAIGKSQADGWGTLVAFAGELRKIAASDPRFAMDFAPIDEFVTGGGQA